MKTIFTALGLVTIGYLVLAGTAPGAKAYTLRASKEPVTVVDSRPASSETLSEKEATARAQLCDRELGPSQIRVWEESDPLVVTHNKTITALTREAPEYDSSDHILGRTYSTLNAQFHLRSKFLTKSYDHFTCMKPSIDVTIKLSDLRVAIANEIPPGSCGFNHVLHHEYKHVRVNKATLHRAAVELDKELHAEFDHKVFFGIEPSAKNELNQRFAKYWAPRVKEMLHMGLAENKQIDNPQEYAENRTACQGELFRIVTASVAREQNLSASAWPLMATSALMAP